MSARSAGVVATVVATLTTSILASLPTVRITRLANATGIDRIVRTTIAHARTSTTNRRTRMPETVCVTVAQLRSWEEALERVGFDDLRMGPLNDLKSVE